MPDLGLQVHEGCGEHDTFFVTPGNVVVSAGRNLEFVNCTFQHLGAYAASALNGSQNISWRGCTFQDVSAGAVSLGDVTTWDVVDTTKWDKGTVLSGSISTVSTVLSWICVGIHSHRALPCPVSA